MPTYPNWAPVEHHLNVQYWNRSTKPLPNGNDRDVQKSIPTHPDVASQALAISDPDGPTKLDQASAVTSSATGDDVLYTCPCVICGRQGWMLARIFVNYGVSRYHPGKGLKRDLPKPQWDWASLHSIAGHGSMSTLENLLRGRK